jgi:hypothetical protein
VVALPPFDTVEVPTKAPVVSALIVTSTLHPLVIEPKLTPVTTTPEPLIAVAVTHYQYLLQ